MFTALVEFRINHQMNKLKEKDEKDRRLSDARLNEYLKGKIKSVKRAAAVLAARQKAA